MKSTRHLLQRMMLDVPQPVLTPYDIYLLARRLFHDRGYQGVGLPGRTGGLTASRVRSLVHNAYHRPYGSAPSVPTEPVQDADFLSTIIRLPARPPGSAVEVLAIADPLACRSHASALAAHGLGPPPPALCLSRPAASLWQALQHERVAADHGGAYPFDLAVRPIRAKPRDRVRGEAVEMHETSDPARPATAPDGGPATSIGRTFADTLDAPERCGGMPAVIALWRQHARLHAGPIIEAVSAAPSKIVKARAGYLLGELLALDDPRIDTWTAAAQRGSSRRLDPQAPYAPVYSEKWMLSLNVSPTLLATAP